MDLLHIPTPWHNTACKIRNDPVLYVVRSNIILEALRSKQYEGEWIPAVKGHGGFFSLQRVKELGPFRTQIEEKSGVLGMKDPVLQMIPIQTPDSKLK